MLDEGREMDNMSRSQADAVRALHPLAQLPLHLPSFSLVLVV